MTMAPRDHNYLRLQFWNRILQINGAAFQSFCEEILKYSYPDFRKVDPFGSVGDGGADGYREIAGVYYQMYAPKAPQFKAKDAADKLEDDFALLKESWDKIHTIKEYYFVFNDKGGGTIVTIEESLAILQNQYPEISFRSLISHDLEKLFFRLDPKQMLALGFDIDATRAISIAHSILDHVRLLLDRWCSKVAAKILVGVEETIASLADEDLSNEYDLLNALALYRQEMVDEAKEKYEKILDKYPNHVKTIVGLAQIYLDYEDFGGHEDLLSRVEAIAPDSMDLKLQRLLRSVRSDRFEEIPGLEESILPTEPKQKSDFLRLYAVKMAMTGELQQAKALIERAILANPNQLQNHLAKLQIVLSSCAKEIQEKPETKATNRASMFAEIDSLEERTREWDAMGPRILAIMNVARIGILPEDENERGIEKMSKSTVEHLFQCSFDRVIDQLLVDLLHFAAWPIKELEALLKYLKANSHKSPSSALCNAIFVQLLFREVLITMGKRFFQETESPRCFELIGLIEQRNYDKFYEMLGGDNQFAVEIALSAKSIPELRWKVVENLPDSGPVQKRKLLLLLHAEEENTKEAFRLLQAMDLSSLGKMEADAVLRVAEQEKAWDFVALIQEKLLDSEEDDRTSAHRKLHLVNALFMLEKYRDVVVIGEELLSDNRMVDHLSADDKERLLALTVQSRLHRAESAEAVKLLEINAQFVKNPRFRFDVEVETYIATNMPDKAIGCLVNGLRQIGSPSPEQFAQLFYATVRIGNLSKLKLTERSEVIPESFVKFKEQERWYFVGSLGALDATLISTDDSRYAAYLGKRVGDVLSTNDRYSSQKHEITIEVILSSEEYVLLRASHCAQRLTKEGRWDKMRAVEVPHTGDTLDLRFLTAFMEDEHQKSREAFDLFCQGQVPFALLALSQGGLTGAVGLICNEERGFILACPNDNFLVSRQKSVVAKILMGEKFYLDGTSALLLSESGLLSKLLGTLEGLHVPQSVITFLLETKDRFSPHPGHVGFMQYVKGEIRRLKIQPELHSRVHKNLEESISALESRSDQIHAISAANKSDCFTEQRIPAYLVDACVFAQKEAAFLLTDDYLFPQAIEAETKKLPPDSTSSLCLVRAAYETGILTFEDYLQFFYYLSTYRIKFLPLSSDDLEKAVFGTGRIIHPRPEQLRLFNFSLTLSEEYGVPANVMFRVITSFLWKILDDDAVLPDLAIAIFKEIMNELPRPRNKRALGLLFIEACNDTMVSQEGLVPIGRLTAVKLKSLRQFAAGYSHGEIELI